MKPEVAKTTLEIPMNVWKAVKIRAAFEHRSMKDIVIEALVEWLQRKKAESISKKEE